LQTADRSQRLNVGYDVFISYATKDKIAADAACARLEAAGIRCWIAPRDIVPGTSYGEAIIEAIHGLKVMVLVFSSNANASAHIPKEVERAMSNGVAIIPFRIEDVSPGKSLDYFIGSVHWLDAMTPPLEKHLDALTETVRKLLPVTPGEAGAPAVQTSGVWQRSAPPAPPAAPIPSTARSASKVADAPASSSKTIWIGVAAVAVLAVVVMAVIMMRGGGGNTPSVANKPDAANPPGVPTAPVNPNPAPAPTSSPTPASGAVTPDPTAAVKPNVDPIVGCYQWFNNAPVTIRSDGTVVGGPFTAQWHAGGTTRAYTITWPPATDTVTISPDQRSLNGANQYGYPASGTRKAGSVGLVGVWRWPNGVPVTVYPDGTFTAASFRGTWQGTDPSRGIYTLTWPSPVDNLKLTADGTRLAGVDQYGIVISGVKTQPCSEN
jgi:hypothetical protein